MAPRTRSRLFRLLVLVAIIAAIREVSIRRHEADLHDWPRPGDPTANGAT
ncbi:MAG: hypothetical protein R8F63_06135 [Acidimicrobiales bacterium]|nr:hypothetical protein [Acidimicrobiales bacterium]